MSKPFILFRNLKMRNQFLIMLSLLVFIILGLLILIFYTTSIFLKSYLLEASIQIQLKEAMKSNRQSTKNYEVHLQRLFEITENQLISMTQIYLHALQFVPKMDPIIIYPEMNLAHAGFDPMPKSLNYYKQWGVQDLTYSFCYTNTTVLDDPLSEIQQIAIKISEYYAATGFISYQGESANQGLTYAYFEDDKFLYGYPCVDFSKIIAKYVVPKRDWYITAKKTYEESSKTKYVSAFTSPYLQYTQQEVGIALVVPTIGKDQEFLGGWGAGVILPKILKQFVLTDDKIETFFLTDEKGVLLMHPFNVTYDQLPVYFYNETITGFDLEDWEQIQSREPISNCVGYLKLSGLLCRNNSRYNKQLQMGITKISKYKMYLIMIIDNMEYTNFQQKFEGYLDNQINNLIMINALQILIIFGLLQIITFLIVTYYLFKPIDWITQSCLNRIINVGSCIKYTKNIIKEENGYFLSNQQIWLMSSQLRELYEVATNFFEQLNHLSMKKTPECENIELRKYPKNNVKKYEKRLLRKIKQKLCYK